MDIIESTGIKELMNEISMCLIDNDINVVIGNSKRSVEAKKKLTELSLRNEEQLQQLKQIDDPVIAGIVSSNDTIHHLNRMAVQQVFIDYEDIINKKAYVLLCAYNIYQKYLENQGDMETKKILYRTLQVALRYIGTKNYTVSSPQYDEQGNYIANIKIVNSVELIKAIKNGKPYDATQNSSKKKLSRLEEIDSKIMLANVVQVLRQEDIRDILFNDMNLAYAVLDQITWNSVVEYIKNHPESNLNQEDIYDEEKIEKFDVILDSIEYFKNSIDVIKQNCKYIDIDKLLLIAAYRYIERLEIDGEKEPEENLKSMQYFIGYLLNEIKDGTKIEGIVNGKDDSICEYSLEQLRNDSFRFVNGKYIKKSDSEDLKRRLLANEVKLDEVDESEIELISMKGDEICKLVEYSDENAMFLIEKNIINSEDIFIFIQILGRCSEKLFVYLCEREMLDAEKIIGLYAEGIIGVDYISKIANEELLGAINSYGKNRLKELYEEMVSCKENNEEINLEQFNKYANLYKALNLLGKSEEELFDEAFSLISTFDDIDSDMLQELYQFGLIPLEAAADWGVNLIAMFSDNSIKPTDLKNLYARDIISIENIRNVILNGSLLYEEKLDLIYSTFDGDSEEDKALREELVELLETGESYKANKSSKKRVSPADPTMKSREFITDPHARWKLISLLDKDYSKKFLPTGKEIKDGHRVFLLPNQDSIVIEKMHEKRHGRKVSAYGSATYIMDTEKFFKNMDLIIVDGAVNRTALSQLHEAKKIEKITHSKGWGKRIKNSFDINIENEKYSEEDIEAIDKAIKAVENSRRERE